MNKPREGNRPGLILPVKSGDADLHSNERHSLVRKVESGLAEPSRDSLRNRILAQNNGWSDAEYWHWVDTGDPPVRSTVRETSGTRPDEIDDDERLHQ